jgi:tetratricopeptide (TPR) repeat protein
MARGVLRVNDMIPVRYKKCIASATAFLIFWGNLSLSLPKAAASGSYDLSVVIWPQKDGVSDDITADSTEALRKALPVVMPVHIVSPQIVDEVLSYHKKEVSGVPENGAAENLARAKEHYFGFHYDEALAEASRAVELFSSGNLSINGSQLQDALITQGIIAKAADNTNLAKDSFDRAVRLNPFYRIDRKLFSPSIVDMFEKSRSEVLHSAKGSLRVETDPEAAEVYLNGVLQGVTPLDLPQTPANSYTLLIKTNKYAPIAKTIKIADGEKLVVREKLSWIDERPPTGKKAAQRANAKAEIEEGLRIADLLKVDKAILVNCDEKSSGAGILYARMIDRQYRSAHRPIVVEYDAVTGRTQAIADLTQTLANLARINLLNDPMKYLDPDGLGDPILLSGRKQKLYKRPIFWGAVGAVAAGAIAGGIAAALSGGSSPRTGAVAVQFK